MIFAILEAAVRALVVALIVWGGLRLSRARNVLVEKTAWGLVLAAAVTMPGLMRWNFLPVTVQIPSRYLHGSPAGQQEPVTVAAVRHSTTTEPSLAAASIASSSPSGRYPAPVISQTEFSNPELAPSAQTTSNVLLQDIFFNEVQAWQALPTMVKVEAIAGAVYGLVAAVLLIRLVAGLVACLRLWRAARPILLSSEEGGSASLRLRESRSITSPVTVGSGVLLPEDWVEWDREKLRIVLAHEDSHVRQGDFYLQTLAGIYAALFWFSPLGWWLKHKLSDLGETISDRAGLEMATSPVSYAQILLEFAASPRPTLIGVAMARKTNLSHRIDRFLNESSFRQAFAGGRRRLLAAILIVPAALLTGTTLLRVQAQSEPQAPPAPAVASPAAAAASSAEPAEAAPSAEPPAASPDVVPPAPSLAPAAPAIAPMPPVANAYIGSADSGGDHAYGYQSSSGAAADSQSYSVNSSSRSGPDYSYSYSSNGDSWALVTDGSQRITFNGDWHDGTREEVEKARRLSNGKFLWFTHDGKSYFIDDPATLSQVEAMYKPIRDLGRQQEELGRRQEELGRQQEELGRKQEEATIPAPDISKEMASLNEAVAKLQAKKGSTVNQEQLADLEGKLGDLQGRLGELQGRVGEKQGEFGRQQGELGRRQGELGEQQGRLGAEQGRLSQEADHKVKALIDTGMRDGKAKPVQ